jgi:hypothetical protein
MIKSGIDEMADGLEGQDTAVVVQLARLQVRMEGLIDSQSALSKKLDDTFSHRTTTHEADIQRIWSAIGERDLKWSNRIDAIETRHGDTKEKVNKILYFSAGVSFVSFVLVMMVGWIGRTEMVRSQRMDEVLDNRADQVELYLAGQRLEPFRRK